MQKKNKEQCEALEASQNPIGRFRETCLYGPAQEIYRFPLTGAIGVKQELCPNFKNNRKTQ